MFATTLILLVQGSLCTYGNMILPEDDIDIEDNTEKQKAPHFPGLSKQKISKGFQTLRGQPSIIIGNYMYFCYPEYWIFEIIVPVQL
jgi:hypothetical protein